jgi:hypothetical protein
VTSQGSAYSRFQRALRTGNLNLIRVAAAELPRVELDDALRICVAASTSDADQFRRFALRWLARFCERDEATLPDVRVAVAAFLRMPADREAAAETLHELLEHRGGR